MRGSIKMTSALTGALLAVGGLAVAVAPSAAACGGYGQPACQTFVLSFNANGGVCSPSSVSATENTWATLLGSSQCTRSGFSLTSWTVGSSSFAPGAQVFVTGNNGFTAVWTSTTPTSSPTATPTGGTSTPTTGPTASPTATPVVSIPPGQTNPDEATRIGSTPAAAAQAGMTLVSQSTASETPVTRTPAPPSERLADAPRIPADRGDTVRVRTQADPGVTYQVRVKRNDGPYNFISRVTGAANGNITLPAIQFDRRGLYTYALTDNAGNTLYVRVNVN